MAHVGLYQLDGSMPNIALMRIATHHRAMGDTVELVKAYKPQALEPNLWDRFDRVYGSAIFERSRPLADRLKEIYPNAIVGGTGVDETLTLESIGITTKVQDYSIYPGYPSSIGFTQRGCRLKCKFCVVPRKEGKVKTESRISEIWRGDPYPKELLLLDNDFFGQPDWSSIISEIRDGGFKVAFSQGINARFLTEETAAAIASVDYRANNMTDRRIYTAWDNKGDEERLFRGLNYLVSAGVKPDHIMVYVLIGYWPGETHDDRDYRRAKLREFGARPYPMAYVRTKELVGFQRWVVGAYDKRIAWSDWERSGYDPRKLGSKSDFPLNFDALV